MLIAAVWKIKLVARVCGMLILGYSFLRKNKITGVVDDRSSIDLSRAALDNSLDGTESLARATGRLRGNVGRL